MSSVGVSKNGRLVACGDENGKVLVYGVRASVEDTVRVRPGIVVVTWSHCLVGLKSVMGCTPV